MSASEHHAVNRCNFPSDVSSADPADVLETSWASPGDAPDLRALLAEHPRWSCNDLRVALLADQQFRCRTSQPWNTEDYLALVPTLEADDELTLDLIYGECRERTRQGNPPNLKELAGRFPVAAAVIFKPGGDFQLPLQPRLQMSHAGEAYRSGGTN